MFLYDHILTYRFIFAPSDTTKFFFINWTNTQQVQLHPSVLSVLTWDSSVLEKQELGLISFSLLSFLKSRMRSNKSCSIYQARTVAGVASSKLYYHDFNRIEWPFLMYLGTARISQERKADYSTEIVKLHHSWQGSFWKCTGCHVLAQNSG